MHSRRSGLDRGRFAAAIVAGATTSSFTAFAQPWTDARDTDLPVRRAAGDTGLELAAEYRTSAVHLASYDLDEGRAGWVDQRLRTHVAVDRDETVRIVLDVDALEGVLWGASSSGSVLQEQAPGWGRVGVTYRGGEPTAAESYDLGVVDGDAARIRHAYGEVWTPLGLLRIGRQPTFEGTTVLFADGEGRANRFGQSGLGDSVDRVQLTTRPLLALDPDAQRDDRGLSVLTHYDLPNQGEPTLGDGEVHRAGLEVRYLAPLPTLEQLYDARARGTLTFGPDSDTVIGTLSTVLAATVYELSVGLEAAFLTGETREQSLALAPFTGDAATLQQINQFGARFVARWDAPSWTAYLEVDYASGDSDPTLDSRLTRFSFAPDANVGLLLFEHVLAHQTARSARAAAVLDERPFGLTPISAAADPGTVGDHLSTEGAFTNAVAFFPQVDVRPTDDLVLRGGVLLAWTPDGLVDPIASLRSRATGGPDVNYRGGDPGFLYGTELDGRVAWRYQDHFYADLEGALLLPGDALHDANGNASTAGLVQGRATFVF